MQYGQPVEGSVSVAQHLDEMRGQRIAGLGCAAASRKSTNAATRPACPFRLCRP